MTGPRVILWLTALGFLVFGTAFTFWALPMARLVDISLPTPTARIDFVATYGGFELGVGAFLVFCARRRDWLEPGLWAGALALSGFATVRLLALLAARGAADRAIYVALAMEVIGVALNVWAVRALHRSRPS